MTAPVTKRHREESASAAYAGGAAVTAWIKSGRSGAKLDPDLPRIAQALAEIEAEAIASRDDSAEREHLEYAARWFLAYCNTEAIRPGRTLEPRVKEWLDAERARRVGP